MRLRRSTEERAALSEMAAVRAALKDAEERYAAQSETAIAQAVAKERAERELDAELAREAKAKAVSRDRDPPHIGVVAPAARVRMCSCRSEDA